MMLYKVKKKKNKPVYIDHIQKSQSTFLFFEIL